MSEPQQTEAAEPEAISRQTTYPSNGDLPSAGDLLPEPVSVGEAMRRALEALGDAVIYDDLAPAQMRQLGEAYENVARLDAAYKARNDAAKTAKKALDSATDLLLLKVKEFTHPTPLPLFDQTEAEAERDAMLDAMEANGQPLGDPDEIREEPFNPDPSDMADDLGPEPVRQTTVSHQTGRKKKPNGAAV